MEEVGVIISSKRSRLSLTSFLIRLQPNESILLFVCGRPDLPIVGIYPR
jgi:hypothetical protein